MLMMTSMSKTGFGGGFRPFLFFGLDLVCREVWVVQHLQRASDLQVGTPEDVVSRLQVGTVQLAPVGERS
jgi:hypothetical protein